ncbi:MAG: hydrogenase maturation nickel metallochaperone HypA [Kiritimatiellae bacterium]|nr:hydrogenase maturation nickel metallochaperone HypA [Kiritimatiellia bacterium]
MHELSIAEAMVEAALRAAHGVGGRIVTLRVSVGALSGVDPDALAFAFPVAARGTLAEAARLEIVRYPAQVHCEQCGATTAADALVLVCGQCGSDHVEITDGRQLRLESLEIEPIETPPDRRHSDV